jgi:hypothetical protein
MDSPTLTRRTRKMYRTYLESLLNAVSFCFQAVLLCLLSVNLKLKKNRFGLTDATVEKHPVVTKNSKKF